MSPPDDDTGRYVPVYDSSTQTWSMVALGNVHLMSQLWTNSGGAIVCDGGSPILCDQCPCGTCPTACAGCTDDYTATITIDDGGGVTWEPCYSGVFTPVQVGCEWGYEYEEPCPPATWAIYCYAGWW